MVDKMSMKVPDKRMLLNMGCEGENKFTVVGKNQNSEVTQSLQSQKSCRGFYISPLVHWNVFQP